MTPLEVAAEAWKSMGARTYAREWTAKKLALALDGKGKHKAKSPGLKALAAMLQSLSRSDQEHLYSVFKIGPEKIKPCDAVDFLPAHLRPDSASENPAVE